MQVPAETGRSYERTGWFLVGLVLLLLSLALLGYKFGGRLLGQVPEAAEVPETVKVSRAAIREHADSARAIGTVAATQLVELRNEVSGVVRQVGFQSGEVVRKGAVLVELDSREERARLSAQLARADLARKQLERARLLRARGFITPAQVDALVAELNGALAEAEALRAMIAKKVLSAPFAARAGIHDLQPGQYLSDGAVITTLQGIEARRFVDFTLPQEVAAIVGLGHIVHVSGTGLPPAGVSTRVSARESMASGSRLVRYRVTVPATDALLPGAFVDVRTTAERARQVVVVPRTALIQKPHASYVFVIEADGKSPGGFRAHQRTVRPGSVIGEDVVILTGLAGGEQIASDGAFKLRDGVAVMRSPAGPGS